MQKKSFFLLIFYIKKKKSKYVFGSHIFVLFIKEVQVQWER